MIFSTKHPSKLREIKCFSSSMLKENSQKETKKLGKIKQKLLFSTPRLDINRLLSINKNDSFLASPVSKNCKVREVGFICKFMYRTNKC